jgi:hypothetical protein
VDKGEQKLLPSPRYCLTSGRLPPDPHSSEHSNDTNKEGVPENQTKQQSNTQRKATINRDRLLNCV